LRRHGGPFVVFRHLVTVAPRGWRPTNGGAVAFDGRCGFSASADMRMRAIELRQPGIESRS